MDFTLTHWKIVPYGTSPKMIIPDLKHKPHALDSLMHLARMIEVRRINWQQTFARLAKIYNLEPGLANPESYYLLHQDDNSRTGTRCFTFQRKSQNLQGDVWYISQRTSQDSYLQGDVLTYRCWAMKFAVRKIASCAVSIEPPRHLLGKQWLLDEQDILDIYDSLLEGPETEDFQRDFLLDRDPLHSVIHLQH